MQVQAETGCTGYRYTCLAGNPAVREEGKSEMNVTELLRTAAAAHDVVTITYDDGSRHGELGIVMPVAVDGEYLQAIVDPTTDVRRKFKLLSIASVRRTNGECASNAAVNCSQEPALAAA